MTEYKIRLKSGRELGPFEADAIQKLVEKGHVDGTEFVRIYPSKDWVPLRSVPELFAMLPEEDGEKTKFFDPNEVQPVAEPSVEETGMFGESTVVAEVPDFRPKSTAPEPLPDVIVDYELHREQTVMLDRDDIMGGMSGQKPPEKPKEKKRQLPAKSFLVLLALAFVVYETLFEEEETDQGIPRVEMVPVRPRLPIATTEKQNPQLSQKLFDRGMIFYEEDTVQGYRKSVDAFQKAISFDGKSVRAMAMLASAYLNLIDASNKDENTFAVINKLIELSRASEIELEETVIAETEFLSVLNRNDAAIQKINNFLKKSPKNDPRIYVQLAWLYNQKHDVGNMARILNLIPTSVLNTPKFFYLRGVLVEQSGNLNDAYNEYIHAIKINKSHAKSMLGLVHLSEKKGEVKKAEPFLSFLMNNPSLLTPREYVETMYSSAHLAMLSKRLDLAVSFLSEALRFDPKNENLRLEYYTLLAQSGGPEGKKYKKLAKMYALVLEGEKHIKAGEFHEGITTLISARDEFPKSAIPVERMGDLFTARGDYSKAERNYSKALAIDPKSARIAGKQIETLIKLYDFKGAQTWISKFKNHPDAKSSIDRLAGDLAFRQGQYSQAIQFYRKAMSRETIDSEVYVSYAETLREVDQCGTAQFFYSVAERLDPLGVRSQEGSALCLLKTDGLPTAVASLQEALEMRATTSPDLLAAIANIYLKGEDLVKARSFVEQIIETNPKFAKAYLIQSKILEVEGAANKGAYKAALAALDEYTGMQESDVEGFLRTYEVALQIPDFDRAMTALQNVFELVPLYPDLHTRRGVVFAKLGRAKDALEEFNKELENNPKNVRVLIQVGNLNLEMGQIDPAVIKFVAAMQLDPSSADAKSGAGYANYLKRNYPSAVALLKAAVSLDKGNPTHYKRLGLALRDSGDRDGARSAFKTYLDLYPDAPDRDQYQ